VSAPSIDLNCDLGESGEPLATGVDLALLDVVTSVNIACGGHAGDETSMSGVVRAALTRGVAIGGHPSYPDRARFGRVELTMSISEIETAVAGQIGALDRIARGLGVTLHHVKPHGALYHAAMRSRAIATAVARAAGRISARVILVGLAGAAALAVWRALGFDVLAEAFADRCYERDGSLRSRPLPGALITDPARAAAQAVRIATARSVVSFDGSIVHVEADTICIHSDTPGAPAIARAVRAALERAGVEVAARGRRPGA
jgi:UPF0271 protein